MRVEASPGLAISSNIVERYFREALDHPLLSFEEEKGLFEVINLGKKAQEKLSRIGCEYCQKVSRPRCAIN